MYVQDGFFYYFKNIAGLDEEDTVILDYDFDKSDAHEYITNVLKKQVIVENGVCESIYKASERPKSVNELLQLSVRIYQLSLNSPLDVRFKTLAERARLGHSVPKITEYDLIYEEVTTSFDLEKIWDRFSKTVPENFRGHALSISDVVELSDGQRSKFFYLERTGFTEIIFNDTANADQI